MSEFLMGAYVGVFVVLASVVPFAWRSGYRAGNEDGLRGERSEGLIVRRVR